MLESNEIVTVSLGGWEWEKVASLAQEILIYMELSMDFYPVHAKREKKMSKKVIFLKKIFVKSREAACSFILTLNCFIRMKIFFCKKKRSFFFQCPRSMH